MAKRPRKIRVGFRKNRQTGKSRTDWTRAYQRENLDQKLTSNRESLRPKGDMTRHRTVIVDGEQDVVGNQQIDPSWLAGRVLSISGNIAIVESPNGEPYTCAISRVLRTLDIDGRRAISPGDRIFFRLTEGAISGDDIGEPQGMIETVCPRSTTLTRAYRGVEHVIVSNVEQVLIVSALADPGLKPNLVDRYVVATEAGGMTPIICLNKVDLVDAALYQSYVALYSQLGYRVLFTSATSGVGIELLRSLLAGRETVLAGQSGVGKSSLLNALEPGLGIRVRAVSEATSHGRHTTTVAQLYKLEMGGWVVDTPGIRQYELWGIHAEEVEAYFLEFRPYVPYCRFPNCAHTHEDGCAVRSAVDVHAISQDRYERYLNMISDSRDRITERT